MPKKKPATKKPAASTGNKGKKLPGPGKKKTTTAKAKKPAKKSQKSGSGNIGKKLPGPGNPTGK